MPAIGIETDYYNVLGLNRSAGDVDVKKAYRNLALKYHPRNDPSETARKEFKRVSEAYDVLSDAHRKGFYDLYGERALKEGIPVGKGGKKGGFYAFDEDEGPKDTFSQFFGTENPYEAINDISARFEALSAPSPLKPGKQKTYEVELSLEEAARGCIKRVTHTRKVLLGDGTADLQERQLTIDIKAGLPAGTKFVFEGEGNATPAVAAGPVVFVLRVAPHARFQWVGSDLEFRASLPLYQALTGTALQIEMLDKRLLSVPTADIITGKSQIRVPGEGMPKPGGGKGDLVIRFDVLFPATLTATQCNLLKAAFFFPHKPSVEQARAVHCFERAFQDTLNGWSTGFPKGPVNH